MRRSLTLIIGLCAATICATGTTVFGDLGTGSPFFSGERFAAQSFKVPDDKFLTAWNFEIAPEADGLLDFYIRTFDYQNRKLGDTVFTTKIPFLRTSGSLVAIPVNVEFTPGAMYAAVYDRGPDEWLKWSYVAGNPYPDGFLSLAGSADEVEPAFYYFGNTAQVFQATFESSLPTSDPGTPSTVPEPATLALVGLSLLGLAGARKHIGRKR